MTLSKKLLLAIAGTGLLAPLAASANELASLNGSAAINDYMQQQDVDRFRAWESKNQVTSVNQFTDVQPTDWAYQALSNLVEKYGCVAGYPTGTYKGGNAMTRYEAAALLNACLDRVTEVTDELERLMTEFKAELATLNGRVDGLETKVGKLAAQQFSTTTKLKGEVSMVMGAVDGNDNYTAANRAAGAGSGNNLVFNYDLRLVLDTSFTGKDKLYTRLRAGNFGSSVFNGNGGTNLTALDKASQSDAGADVVFIDRLYYTFPVSSVSGLTLTFGPLARNTEAVAFVPQAYKSDVLDYFGLAGAPGVYNKASGSLFGFVWKQKAPKGKPYFTASSNYVTANGTQSNSAKGVFNGEKNSWLTQLGVVGTNWGAAFAFNYGNQGTQVRRGSDVARQALDPGQNSLNYSLAGYWKPMEVGYIPSISIGLGYTDVSTDAPPASGVAAGDSFGWTIGLQWDDAFAKGNAFGFAFGQPQYGDVFNATTNVSTSTASTYAYELFYRFAVSDNISVTPALFYVQNGNGGTDATSRDVYGALVQTTFKF